MKLELSGVVVELDGEGACVVEGSRYGSLRVMCAERGIDLDLGKVWTIPYRGEVLVPLRDALPDVDPVQYANPRAGEGCYLAPAVDPDGRVYRLTWYGEVEGIDWDRPDRVEER